MPSRLHPCRIPGLRRGTAFVELAFILPVLLTIIFGAIEFGRAMMVEQLLNNAACQGARQAIAEGSSNKDVDQKVKQYLVHALGVSPEDIDVTVEMEQSSQEQIGRVNGSPSHAGNQIQVTVRIDFDDVCYMAGRFLQGTMLEGRCVMPRS